MIFPSSLRLAPIVRCLFVATLVVSACSSDADTSSDVTVGADDPTTTSRAPAETTTTEDPEAAIKAEVEAAFYAMWDALADAGAARDPNSPQINDTFTGEAREGLLDAISELVATGRAVRLPDNSHNFQPRVNVIEILDAATAVVFECSIDGLVVYEIASGAVIDETIDQVANRNVFKLLDGRWKLAEFGNLQPGDPTCEF